MTSVGTYAVHVDKCWHIRSGIQILERQAERHAPRRNPTADLDARGHEPMALRDVVLAGPNRGAVDDERLAGLRWCGSVWWGVGWGGV